MNSNIDGPLKNISDTAFLVATYRAIESERPDALFKDPFASLLVGDHGRSIVNKMSGGKSQSWFLVARTSILDSWIIKLIENEKIDTVLNLAAGLDTRAYRLPLPTSLKWFDVDLPAILTHKEHILKSFSPTCRFESIKLDLSDSIARSHFFKRVSRESKKTLVISEGFLMYLNPEQAANLATELSQYPAFQFWLAELLGPLQLKWIKLKWGKYFEAANAVMNFAPAEGPGFFVPYGWIPHSFKSSFLEAIRIGRAPWGANFLSLFIGFFPKLVTKKLNTAGIALLINAKK
ncbi:MAG: SAM-dependent methyltransferase [Proteobacteria bacterium]|nr:SAM-dependent methyltransferase [Pseudomonadota bacterium]